jgi:hypothetical protein
MKKCLFVSMVFIMTLSQTIKAQLITSNTITAPGTYNFNNTAIWIGGVVPTNLNNVDIVINLTTASILPVIITGTININALNLFGNLKIKNIGANSATVRINATGTVNTKDFTVEIPAPTAVPAGAGGSLTVDLNSNMTVRNMFLNNNSALASKSLAVRGSVLAASTVAISGNLELRANGASALNTVQYSNPPIIVPPATTATTTSTTITGDVILGSATSIATEGTCKIGKAPYSALVNQTYNVNGNLILNPRSGILTDNTVFNFNKAGVQKIINRTSDIDADVQLVRPLKFEQIKIGTSNATTVIFDEVLSTNPYAYLINNTLSTNPLNAGITIGINSTLDLPRNYTTGIDFSFNTLPATAPVGVSASPFACNLTMLAGAKLRIGGIKTESGSAAPGVAGSNFPNIRDSDPSAVLKGRYNIHPTSIVEYYGNATTNALFPVTQTIYSLPTPYSIALLPIPNTNQYGKLIANDLQGTGIGRAKKITAVTSPAITAPLTVVASFDIKTKTDVTLGLADNSIICPLYSGGLIKVAASTSLLGTDGGGLYCNANVVSGTIPNSTINTGTFSLGDYAFLGMGHALGISPVGTATGNVQMLTAPLLPTDIDFPITGNYIYNGIVPQITGLGLPQIVNDLTTDNPTTVTIGRNQIVNGVCLLAKGVFDIGTTKITSNGIGKISRTLPTLVEGTGKMKANAASFGLFPSNQIPTASATVEMKGNLTTQDLSGDWFVDNTIATLVDYNVMGITVAPAPASSLLVAVSLEYGKDAFGVYIAGSTIKTNDNLTLLSRDDAAGTLGGGTPELGNTTGTANFGNATGNIINGRVTIERYLPKRGVALTGAWRLLSTPIVMYPTDPSSPTVAQSWREGQAPFTFQNYGTIITGPQATASPAPPYGITSELDYYTIRGSMKYYNALIQNYIELSNTTTTKIANTEGYYVFVRGDRTVPVPLGSSVINNTTLRIKGLVRTGDQAFPVLAGKYATVGNPYPARIDFRTTLSSKIAHETFTVWNPIYAGLHSVGAFQKYVYDGVDYKIAGTAPYPPNPAIRNYIESGEAFFVESHEPASPIPGPGPDDGTLTIRESDKASGSHVSSRIPQRYPALEVGMFIENGIVYTDPNTNFANGVIVNFDDAYSFGIDNMDIWKWDKVNNNLHIKNGITLLLAERRPYFRNLDTIPLNIANMTVGKFRFDITPNRLSSLTDVSLYLRDNYTNTESTVSLSDITSYKFEITADVATAAANRFLFISRRSGILAEARSASNNVSNPVVVSTNNTQAVNEVTSPSTFNLNVKEDVEKANVSTSVQPNPIMNGMVNLRLDNKKTGKCVVQVTNQLGQLIKTETLQVQSKNSLYSINIGNASKGSYQVTIIDEDGNKNTIGFAVN